MKLEADDISFSYEETRAKDLVFRNLSFSIAQFSSLALLGPSGSGKTTLLKLIGGLLTPTRGELRIGGRPARGHDKAYVPQEPSLLPWKTLEQNASLAERLVGGQTQTEFRLDLLRLFGLTEHQEKYPRELSGGMKQRTALVNALSARASVLLLDEPFSGSDHERRVAMYSAVQEFSRRTDKAVIFTTHNMPDVLAVADAVLWLGETASAPPSIILAPSGWTEGAKSELAALMMREEIR